METGKFDRIKTIKVTEFNHEELTDLRIVPQESYNNVITRLIKSYKEASLRTVKEE